MQHLHGDEFSDGPEQYQLFSSGGKAYFLTPDGPVGQKPYALLRQAMAEEGLWCLAQTVLSGREQLVLLRPSGKLIAMQVLHYAGQLKSPTLFTDDVADSQFTAAELKLTRTLVAATTAKELDLAQYQDLYRERLRQLVQAKVEGRQMVAAPEPAAMPVVNLIDALKASVARTQPSGRRPAAGKKRALTGRTSVRRAKAG